jgi:hypothetical protein
MKESENIFSISQKRAQILHSLWKRSVQKLVSLAHVAFKNFCTFQLNFIQKKFENFEIIRSLKINNESSHTKSIAGISKS